MSINRRTLLKAIAAAPAMPLFQSNLVSALVGEGSPSAAYILLHGMFFLEFADKGQTLYVATPTYANHKLYVRRHGQGFSLPPKKDIDMTAAFTAGTLKVFPPDVPQFARTIISQNPVLPAADPATFQLRLKLPTPKCIFGYRTDTKDNFHPKQQTTVGKAILDSIGPRVATITCLEYDSGANAPYVDSYYAEHCDKPSPDEVNTALTAAKTLLGNNFDLQFDNIGVADAREDDDGSLPSGVTHADENEFREFSEVRPAACIQNPDRMQAKGADVASCPQFGLT